MQKNFSFIYQKPRYELFFFEIFENVEICSFFAKMWIFCCCADIDECEFENPITADIDEDEFQNPISADIDECEVENPINADIDEY